MKDKKLSELTVNDVAKWCLWGLAGLFLGIGTLYLIAWFFS